VQKPAFSVKHRNVDIIRTVEWNTKVIHFRQCCNLLISWTNRLWNVYVSRMH